MPPKSVAYLDGKEYDVEKLQQLSKRSQFIFWPINQKYLTHRVWKGRSPGECLLTHDREHFERIYFANIFDPILIEPLHGRVIDGYHRIIKALMLGVVMMQAKQLTSSMMDKAFVRKLTPKEKRMHNQNVFGTKKDVHGG